MESIVLNVYVVDSDNYFAQGVFFVLQSFLPGISVNLLDYNSKEKANIIIAKEGECFVFNSMVKTLIITKNNKRNEFYERNGIATIKKGACVKSFLLSIYRLLSTGNPSATHSLKIRLTYREFEVISDISRGRTVGEIAKYLNLSVKTVSAHKRNVMRKYGLRSNCELFNWLRRGGLNSTYIA